MIDKVEKSDILPGYKSDHSAVTLSFISEIHEKGSGYWKLNCSYLHDEDFLAGIRKTISDTVEFNHQAEPILLWETLKCQIRGFALRFASRKKKSKINIMQVLEKRINFLENVLKDNYSDETELQLMQVRDELNKYIEEKTKGAMIRSKCRWYEDGEKSTKYFLNLEKRNYNNKTLDRLMTENGTIVDNPHAILKEQKSFYQTLYTTRILEDDSEPTIPIFLSNIQDFPKLTDEMKDTWEQDITEQEILCAIKTTPNGKSPGLDGLPIEFYKIFWNDIKKYLIDSFEASYQEGKLSTFQSQGLITLIPKKEKNPLYLKNWRPLTLLNVDYKILAKVIANRIKVCLDEIINRDQTGFMKNRYIGENIIKALSIIEYAEEENIPALLMFVDYEKAFDTVEWCFIEECLNFFNFSNKIISWFKILYKNISSRVINNGWLSDSFSPTRGVRQGCPLSPYLFIIVAEIFAISIRNNEQIKGIEINGKSSKIGQYADDAFIAFLFDKKSLDEILITIDKFEEISGLKVNYDKTEILRIGSLKNSDAQLYTQRNLKWTNNPSVLLGIEIGTNIQDTVKKNYSKVITKIENLIKIWRSRQLTILGRIVIIKTLLVSQLIYNFSVLPSPNPEQMKHLNKLLSDYLWNHKKHYVDKSIMINCLTEGGLGMLDVCSKDIAMKCNWVKRLNDNSNCYWKVFARHYIPNADKLFWTGNLKVSDGIILMTHNSIFWRNIVRAWCIYNYSIPNSIEDILNQQIWYNSFILVGGCPIYSKALHRKGILLIKDIVGQDGYLMTTQEIMVKYDLNNRFWILINSIVSAVPQAWKTTLSTQIHQIDRNYIYLNKFQRAITNEKTSKFIYHYLIDSKSKSFSDKIIEKWDTDIRQGIGINRNYLSDCFSLIIKSTISPKHRAFQFRLLHRILVTNKMLNDWKIIDSNLCSFCNSEIETIYHMLWDCTIVRELWVRLFYWLTQITDTNILFNSKDILLGIPDENLMVYNTIFTITKHYIYVCRCKSEPIYIDALISNIKFYKNVEKYIAVKNNKIDYHNKKWELLHII